MLTQPLAELLIFVRYNLEISRLTVEKQNWAKNNLLVKGHILLNTEKWFSIIIFPVSIRSNSVSGKTKFCTVKPVLSSHSKEDKKGIFKTGNHLMQVKSFAECSPWSILQYFRPELSYHLSLRPLFCLFLSGCLR